jgi:hypothetical protein
MHLDYREHTARDRCERFSSSVYTLVSSREAIIELHLRAIARIAKQQRSMETPSKA